MFPANFGYVAAYSVEEALQLLAERYVQYRATRPAGPVVAISVERITGWSAT